MSKGYIIFLSLPDDALMFHCDRHFINTASELGDRKKVPLISFVYPNELAKITWPKNKQNNYLGHLNLTEWNMGKSSIGAVITDNTPNIVKVRFTFSKIR